MTRRSALAVVILTFVTFGIYGLFWMVKTKDEMNAQGADIPTAILLIVPIVNLWWLWRYSQGVEQVSRGQMSAPVSFLLLWLLSFIGMAIVQDQFNRASSSLPEARLA